MSDFYVVAVNIADAAMHFVWAAVMCLLYRHFFRLKSHPDSRLFTFLPGALWLVIKKTIDSAIVIATLTTPEDSMKGLAKQLLVYGSLFLVSFCFYTGTRKQLALITMMFAAVSEIGRFMSFTLSIFWNMVYDLGCRWFEQGYPRVTVEDYIFYTKVLGIIQQFSYAIVFVAVTFYACRYVKRVYKSRDLPLHRTEFLFLMLPCVSSFLLCTLLRVIMYTTENAMPKLVFEAFPLLKGIVPFLLVLCLFSILFSVKLYQEMLALNEERNRRAVLEKQVVSMEEHARELERLYSGVRSMKHDMKNQLAVLGSLIGRREGGEELPGYLEQLNHTLGKLDLPFQTGSTVVDSLLSMKYHEVCEKLPGVRFEADGLIFPKDCPVQPTDLCIILGNALDNAIEACEKAKGSTGQEEGFIRLRSQCCRETLLLIMENNFDGELRLCRGNAFPGTTKADSDAHGIGMHNIRTAARRCGGGVTWEAKGNCFILTVMLTMRRGMT